MSRYLTWKTPQKMIFQDKEVNLTVQLEANGNCEYTYLWDAGSMTEEELDRIVKDLIVNALQRYVVQNANSFKEVVRAVVDGPKLLNYMKGVANLHGLDFSMFAVINMQMDKESHEAYVAVFKSKAEEEMRKYLEKQEKEKQAAEKPKQLTAEELAALPTGSGPLDSVKEKIGKIFGIFSK